MEHDGPRTARDPDLVAGAELLPSPEADWARALADFWNANIERWLTVSGTELARHYDLYRGCDVVLVTNR